MPTTSAMDLRTWFLLTLLVSPALLCCSSSDPESHLANEKKVLKEKVRQMFYHAYDNYMKYTFPHDELKPISKTFTDSVSELGNLKKLHSPPISRMWLRPFSSDYFVFMPTSTIPISRRL